MVGQPGRAIYLVVHLEENVMNTGSQPSPAGEEYLVGRSATGDLEAFNELVLMHQDLLHSHALALLGDASLASDAVQEGLIKAFRGMKSFRGGSFRAWLLRITGNCCRDLMRNARRRPSVPLLPEDEEGEEVDSPAWLADPSPSVQEIIESRELSQHIYRAMDQLPRNHRNLLFLVDVHELDYQEAAQALDIPLGTVKSRLARARLQMRAALQQSTERPESCAGMLPAAHLAAP
jgi:RNA polymerase sigma-70 factor (ECF subfamily)